MDLNLRKAILDFQEKLKNQDSTIDCIELEKCLREFKTELYIKRDEVKLLRAELDNANLEKQNLKISYDYAKKSLDETQLNINLLLKKSRNNEEELQEKRESLLKTQLQYKMTLAEVESLKEKLQKTEVEKIDLCRRVNAFETKQRHNSVYHNEILKRDDQLKTFIKELNEMVTKLQTEHLEVTELLKNSKVANEELEKLKLFVTENEKLRNEKEHFEEMYIKTNAKYEKLEELLTSKVKIINEPNLLTKIIFNQWKMNRNQYEVQMKQTNEILNKVNELLCSEKTANIKLIQQNELLGKKNYSLEEEVIKLKEINNKMAQNIQTLKNKIDKQENNIDVMFYSPLKNTSKIKDEPIEID